MTDDKLVLEMVLSAVEPSQENYNHIREILESWPE